MLGYDTYTKLYGSLVSPVTDYGSAIWGTKSYDSMDRVQNRATRFLWESIDSYLLLGMLEI